MIVTSGNNSYAVQMLSDFFAGLRHSKSRALVFLVPFRFVLLFLFSSERIKKKIRRPFFCLFQISYTFSCFALFDPFRPFANKLFIYLFPINTAIIVQATGICWYLLT